MANILDGKIAAAEILSDVKKRADTLALSGRRPGLATVLVGEDPASQVYVGQKIKRCAECGIASIHKPFPASISQENLLAEIDMLNKDPRVHGIIIQLPLPQHLHPDVLIQALNPKKDADGLHPLNQGIMGRCKSWKDILSSGIPLPCTPAGIIQLLLRNKINFSRIEAVVVGRSTLVGKPVAQLLLSLDATVTMAHSKTKDLMAICRRADILVAALGQPGFITKEGIKRDAVVVDVGISRTPQGLKGDVLFDDAMSVASWVTPVPGGVGAMTVAMLLQNTVTLAENS